MLGSSPLARGTRCDEVDKGPGMGLIPARAGNTAWSRSAAWPSWAHPRSRGEHSGHEWKISMSLGSSPLARGTPVPPGSRRRAGGLIPARAGNTVPPPARGRGNRAHPRSRGEHERPHPFDQEIVGSSPLARGTRNGVRVACRSGGLIPARAGNTKITTRANTAFRAHPRSRGEHADFTMSILVAVGSSPLARGTRVFCVYVAGSVGLIPARAGNTQYQGCPEPAYRAHPRSRGEHQ